MGAKPSPKWASFLVHTTAVGYSVVVLDVTGENQVVEVAAELARETGRYVSVTDENETLIEAIPAAGIH